MRPRVFPAEDSIERLQAGPIRNASMRPRVFPAEDAPAQFYMVTISKASMRPRVFPAEDGDVSGIDGGTGIRFNEAAGIPRGRLNSTDRPRKSPDRFNEAAGIPRGRPGQTASRISVGGVLQ